MEILGCGMVHPAVLENCNVDPERYTGLGLRHGAAPDRDAALRDSGHPAAAGGGHAVPGAARAGGQADARATRGDRMNVSLRWLEAFLRRPLDPRDAADRLTMLGAPVDAVEPLHAGSRASSSSALVREVRRIPNADRLRSV